MDNYLGSLKESKVRSLQELVEWNAAHAKEALTEGIVLWEKIRWYTNLKVEYPFQDLLEQGLAFGDSAEAREKPLAHSKAVAANFDEMVAIQYRRHHCSWRLYVEHICRRWW